MTLEDHLDDTVMLVVKMMMIQLVKKLIMSSVCERFVSKYS